MCNDDNIIIIIFVHQSWPCFVRTSFSPARPSLPGLPRTRSQLVRSCLFNVRRRPRDDRRLGALRDVLGTTTTTTATTTTMAAARVRYNNNNNNNNNIIISYTTIRYPHRVYNIIRQIIRFHSERAFRRPEFPVCSRSTVRLSAADGGRRAILWQ